MLTGGGRRLWRAVIRVAVPATVATAGAAALFAVTITAPAVSINVRWAPELSQRDRVDLEQRFGLASGSRREGTTYQYQLLDPSSSNIRALVEHPAVDDTANLHRTAFRPPLRQYRPFLVATRAMLAGVAAGLVWAFGPAVVRRARRPVRLTSRAVVAAAGAAPWALIGAALLFILAAAAGLL
ncbi:MAG: hypothetical protein AB7P99_19630 [Vicinamibacterales bacterium]